MRPLLEVEGLVARIDQADVLQGVTLSVGTGEAVCVLGPNGAGKTTLLRTVSGLVEMRGGDVRLGGESLAGVSPWDRVDRGIAHVPQDRRCFGPLTVTENLKVGAYLRPEIVQRRMAEVMELFPALHEKRDAHAGDLSGGQQQMLAIGRALMSEPKLLLLDEPTLGLAPKFVQQLQQLLERLAAAKDITILLVEQNLGMATDVCERAYVLQAGRVAIAGRACADLSEEEVADAYLAAGAA